jgi:DnaK suppressor protein
MPEDSSKEFRDALLKRRSEILGRLQELESGWKQLAGREIELQEEAQKLSITEIYDQLDDRAIEEVEDIDLALSKLALGEYGICETCGDEINKRRLQALPTARQCVACARDYERQRQKLSTAREALEEGRIPVEFQGLTESELVRAVRERLSSDDRLSLDELHVSVQGGILHLNGKIPNKNQHKIIMQILTDDLGFVTVVDSVQVTALMKGKRHRATGAKIPAEEQILYNEEEIAEDVFEAEEEAAPYTVPDKPLPEEQ